MSNCDCESCLARRALSPTARAPLTGMSYEDRLWNRCATYAGKARKDCALIGREADAEIADLRAALGEKAPQPSLGDTSE
jgi:hypothetical protein